MPYLLQGGLGMPDRAYYLTDSPKMAELRAKYQAHIAAMLKLAGYADSDARAAEVFALETEIAKSTPRAKIRPTSQGATTLDSEGFRPQGAGHRLAGILRQRRPGRRRTGSSSGIRARSGAPPRWSPAPLATWKDYLAFHQINHSRRTCPRLGRPALRLLRQGTVRHAGTAAALEARAGRHQRRAREAVGQMYVERYFPAEAKARVQAMVTNIVAAFSQRIDKLDWMAPATRAQAQDKLRTLYVGVGYPEQWRTMTA